MANLTHANLRYLPCTDLTLGAIWGEEMMNTNMMIVSSKAASSLEMAFQMPRQFEKTQVYLVYTLWIGGSCDIQRLAPFARTGET